MNLPANTPIAVAQRSPGWWQRHWKWAVPAGGAVLGCLVIGFVVGLFAVIMGVMRSTEVYRTALSEARGEPEVIAALGVPIEEGFLFTGEMEVRPASGFARLAIPIKGPAGAGVIHVDAEKSGSRWSYETLEVVLEDGTVDLMADW